MLEPKTRLEYDLDGIVNSHELLDPKTRIEQMLNDIASGRVTTLTPKSRKELYLAKISGADVVVPEPRTRIEMFLYAIAGGDIDLLEPKDRIELWLAEWAEQSGGIEKTVIGNPIHILDALAKPAQALSVKLEPVQDLHGYSYPWPAGGGVNLLDPAKCSTIGPGGAYGLIVTHDQATAIWTISGTPTLQNASLAFNFCTYSDFSLSGKGYQIQAFPISGTPIKNVYGFRNEAESRIAIIIDTVANPTVNVTFKVSVAATAQTAWSPYSNICPISGWTGANVYHSGADTSDATTYSITFPSEAGTVYGGTLDVTTGKLTVDRAMVTFDGSTDETWTYSSYYAKTNTLVFYTSVLTDAYYPDWTNYHGYTINLFPNATRDYLYYNDVECMGFTGTAGVSASPTVRILKTRASNETEFRSFLNNNPIQFVYELATPQTIQLTPQQVKLLLGENNIWSDGEMTLTYLADGNASDEEALNILLGGRYVNSHSEDEPTDREALNIILGGNER